MKITFDKKTGRFRGSNGRFVTERSVRDTINKLGDTFKSEAGKASKAFNEGKISREVWANKMAGLIKNNIVVSASIGRGGHKQMTRSDWGRSGAAIKREYKYLRRFAGSLNKLSPAQIVARSRQYAQAGFVEYSRATQEMKKHSATEAKRNLHASESCRGCLSLAGEWMPIDEMPLIGSQQCGHRCRCSISYR